MDLRTHQLLAALDPPSVEILVVLLSGPMSEKELRKRVPDLKQAQVNKKLSRLAQVGLIHHHASHAGRGAPWNVSAMEPTRDLLRSLLQLSEALDIDDRSKREAMHAQITQPRLIALHGGGENKTPSCSS
jgi:DNA-binding HxlR family transcriptional regulator